MIFTKEISAKWVFGLWVLSLCGLSTILTGCEKDQKAREVNVRAAGHVAQDFAKALSEHNAEALPGLTMDNLGVYCEVTATVHEYMVKLSDEFRLLFPKELDHPMLKRWFGAGWRPFQDVLECKIDGKIAAAKTKDQERHFRLSYRDRNNLKRQTIIILKKGADRQWRVSRCDAFPLVNQQVGDAKSIMNKLVYSHATALKAVKAAAPASFSEGVAIYTKATDEKYSQVE